MASNELSHSSVSSGSRSVSWAAMPSLIRLIRGADWSLTDAVKATPHDSGRMAHRSVRRGDGLAAPLEANDAQPSSRILREHRSSGRGLRAIFGGAAVQEPRRPE